MNTVETTSIELGLMQASLDEAQAAYKHGIRRNDSAIVRMAITRMAELWNITVPLACKWAGAIK